MRRTPHGTRGRLYIPVLPPPRRNVRMESSTLDGNSCRSNLGERLITVIEGGVEMRIIYLWKPFVGKLVIGVSHRCDLLTQETSSSSLLEA